MRRKWFFTSLLIGSLLVTNNMVLQQAVAVPISGRADPIDALLRETGVKRGLIVHVGPVATTKALGQSTQALAHGLVRDYAAVPSARATIQEADLAGRVTVSAFDGQRLPFNDRLANMIVLDSPSGVDGKELARVLVPRGIAVTRSGLKEVPKALQAVSFPVEGWNAYRRVVPDDIDDWSHFMHGPDNNAVAADTKVGLPGGLQWVADPRWSREHDMMPSIFGIVSEQGRIFYGLDEGPIGAVDTRFPSQFFLHARDAFNGVHLWKREIKNWYLPRTTWGHIPVESHRRTVAEGDNVYATLGIGQPVSKLDARTGKTLAVYEETQDAAELIVIDGALLAAIRKIDVGGLRQQLHDRRGGGGGRSAGLGPAVSGQAIVAIDANNGKTLWRVTPGSVPMTMAAGDGHVVYAAPEHVVCRSLKDGRELWRSPANARSLVIHKDVVLTATYPQKGSDIELQARSLADGKKLWSKSGGILPTFRMFATPADLFVANDVVWALGEGLEWRTSGGRGSILGLDYKTGKQVHTISAKGAFGAGHHQRCYPNKATENFLLTGKRGTEFLGLKPGDKAMKHQWVRGTCRFGILPCNGLLYAPPHSCACSPGAQLSGFVALAAEDDVKILPPASGNAIPGPAHGHWRNTSQADDWPTYRADSMRCGTSQTVLPKTLSVDWEIDLGGTLSPAVQADGRVYVSVIDKHQVASVDAATGNVLWTHQAGARVDSPPTLHKGLAIFGCRDGWVTALRDTDGAVAWRFRAAPGIRQLIARDQVESVWPVLGSVLVLKDTVYVTAGRSLFLDGGLYLYGLDARTGTVRYRKHLETLNENRDDMRVSDAHISGADSRILQADDKQIYMGHVMFDHELKLSEAPGDALWGMTPRGQNRIMPTAGFLDNTMYNRNYWTFRNVHTRYPQDDARAQLMVQDAKTLYGIRYFWGRGWNSPGFKAGEGYSLYSRSTDISFPDSDGRHQLATKSNTWETNIPVRVSAMVMARTGSTGNSLPCLVVAGAPDVVDAKDPLAAFEGRKGAVLQLHDAATGKRQRKMILKSPPVFDGMIAAEGSLIISSENGTLIKIGD